MNIKLLFIALIIGSIVISGCATKVAVTKTRIKDRIVKTAELKLNEADSDLSANKNIRISVKPVFGKTITQYPQLVKSNLLVEYINQEYRYSYKYGREVLTNVQYSGNIEKFPLFPLPIFEVSITNNTKHVLKFANAVLALKDSSGNIFDALSQSDATEYVKKALILALAAEGVPNDKVDSAVDISDLYLEQLLVHLVDNNFKVLPTGRTKKGFLAFNYGKFTNEAFKKFVYGQNRLNVQLFEIPIDVDKAGNTVETASFSFSFDVKIH